MQNSCKVSIKRIYINIVIKLRIDFTKITVSYTIYNNITKQQFSSGKLRILFVKSNILQLIKVKKQNDVLVSKITLVPTITKSFNFFPSCLQNMKHASCLQDMKHKNQEHFTNNKPDLDLLFFLNLP